MINIQGYYRSVHPKEYHDSYGGHYIEEKKYTYLVFLEDDKALYHLNKKSELRKSDVSEILESTEATYEISGKEISIYVFPSLEFFKPLKFLILSSNRIKANNIKDEDDFYEYHHWAEEEL